MSQFLLVETGLLPSHTRSSFTATVYHDFLRKEGQFRPSVSDLQLDFKDHWKSILKATSSITSLLPLAIRDNTLYPTASLAIRDYALYLASADRDDPSLAHTSNWKPLDRFTDQELMELIKLCLRQRRPLRTALMTGTQVSWLRDEWEREVRQRELERLRHLEVSYTHAQGRRVEESSFLLSDVISESSLSLSLPILGDISFKKVNSKSRS